MRSELLNSKRCVAGRALLGWREFHFNFYQQKQQQPPISRFANTAPVVTAFFVLMTFNLFCSSGRIHSAAALLHHNILLCRGKTLSEPSKWTGMGSSWSFCRQGVFYRRLCSLVLCVIFAAALLQQGECTQCFSAGNVFENGVYTMIECLMVFRRRFCRFYWSVSDVSLLWHPAQCGSCFSEHSVEAFHTIAKWPIPHFKVALS